MRVKFSSRAREELRESLVFSAYHHGARAAATYQKELLRSISRLERFPELGKLDPDFEDGTRYLVVTAHRVVYTIVGDEVFVSRITPTRRDSSTS